MRALVTGAASGIGRATCLRLARDARAQGKKAQIAAVDIGPSAGLDGLLDELRELEADPLALHGDMGTADSPGRVVGEAVTRFGGLDGLVSNAGINRPGPLISYAVEDWDRVFAVNTRATWLLAKAAYQALKASRGAIVAVGSMSGTNPHANLGPYGPTKAAVIMLAQVLAQELGRDGIRVNGVHPGYIWGDSVESYFAYQAQKRGITPEERYQEVAADTALGYLPPSAEIAEAVVFFASDMSKPITGQALGVNAGQWFQGF